MDGVQAPSCLASVCSATRVSILMLLGAVGTAGRQGHTRQTEQRRPSSTGTHSHSTHLCSPLIKVVLPLGLASRADPPGQRLRLRQVPFLPSSSGVLWVEQMPGQMVSLSGLPHCEGCFWLTLEPSVHGECS